MASIVIISIPHLYHLLYPLQAEVGANPATINRWYYYLFKPLPGAVEHLAAAINHGWNEDIVDEVIDIILSDTYVDDIMSFLDTGWRSDLEEMIYYCLHTLCSEIYEQLKVIPPDHALYLAPIARVELLGGNSLLIRTEDGYNYNRPSGRDSAPHHDVAIRRLT
jgi:hypothetical protein